jgi:hypothetical protein
MLEKRIDFLSGLLSNYDIEYLDKKYREIELRHTQESFQKARYSDTMKKRMLAEAKRKNISKSKKLYIQSLISRNENFDPSLYQDKIKTQLSIFFNDPKLNFSDVSKISQIFFEHSYDPKSVHANVYKDQPNEKDQTEFLQLKTKLDFSPIWGFIEGNKFDSIYESLEGLEIEDEEYPQIIMELFKLRSYKLLKDILNSKPLENIMPAHLLSEKSIIIIGEHDNWKYEIFKR